MVSASYVSKWSHGIMEMIEEKTLRAMKTFLIEDCFLFNFYINNMVKDVAVDKI